MHNPYGSSDFTANNPFVSDPQSRYPDINGAPPAQDPSAAQFTQWLQPGAQSPAGFPNQNPGAFQQQPFQQQQFQQQQFSPQFSPGGYNPQQGYAAPQSPTQFQPTSSFGQQMAGQVSGSSYGYLQGQNTAVPQTGYNPVQQQLQNNPGYIPQFDPYASIGQGWDGQAPAQQIQPSNPQGPQSPGAFATTTSRPGQSHPREYVHAHKAEIASWDAYAWKQLLNSFDGLKDAWELRKKELEGNIAQLQQQLQYGGYYAGQIQQETGRLQGMVKEAELNFGMFSRCCVALLTTLLDSVAASSFQMHEVFTNYRQSGDLASKNRVREASNAAIQSLPDWPPLAY
ncbi:hypothetical protein C8J57DRAFT_1290016 [Mycena rebaudengoi]|nr:hypothetical protein C8J57DRAFT_1290016 [Mycena rebaudengoi]